MDKTWDGPFTIFIFIESGGGSKVVNLMVNYKGMCKLTMY